MYISGSHESWRLSQLTLGESQGTPSTARQCLALLTYQNTFSPNMLEYDGAQAKHCI